MAGRSSDEDYVEDAAAPATRRSPPQSHQRAPTSPLAVRPPLVTTHPAAAIVRTSRASPNVQANARMALCIATVSPRLVTESPPRQRGSAGAAEVPSLRRPRASREHGAGTDKAGDVLESPLGCAGDRSPRFTPRHNSKQGARRPTSAHDGGGTVRSPSSPTQYATSAVGRACSPPRCTTWDEADSALCDVDDADEESQKRQAALAQELLGCVAAHACLTGRFCPPARLLRALEQTIEQRALSDQDDWPLLASSQRAGDALGTPISPRRPCVGQHGLPTPTPPPPSLGCEPSTPHKGDHESRRAVTAPQGISRLQRQGLVTPRPVFVAFPTAAAS